MKRLKSKVCSARDQGAFVTGQKTNERGTTPAKQTGSRRNGLGQKISSSQWQIVDMADVLPFI
jgi:hypothetical protein